VIMQGWDIYRTNIYDLCKKWCPYVPYIYTDIVLGGTRWDRTNFTMSTNTGALGHRDSIR
jgi:hypothetical protein